MTTPTKPANWNRKRCYYCGAPSPTKVCEDCSDLPALDPLVKMRGPSK